MMFFTLRAGCCRAPEYIKVSATEIEVLDSCDSWTWGKAGNPDYSKPPFYPQREYRSYLVPPIRYDDWTPPVRSGKPEDYLFFMYSAGWSPERLAA